MEENLAILMADLSGYTALTEIHGSFTAADLIDKYLNIVNQSLVGDARLIDRTGDAIMIISKSPESLLATSLLLLKTACKEEYFLQLHGGIHFGKVLKRKESYFGSPINLTSRIMDIAKPGTFWCSVDFVNMLNDKSFTTLHSVGKQSFKNVSSEKEVFEIRHDHSTRFFIDPVCRMLILDNKKAIKHSESEDIYFCSVDCHDIYINKELT
jgi:adenylate cyclase